MYSRYEPEMFELPIDSKLDPGEWPGQSLGKRPFLTTPGAWFQRTLCAYIHPKPVLALLGGVSHLSLYRICSSLREMEWVLLLSYSSLILSEALQ